VRRESERRHAEVGRPRWWLAGVIGLGQVPFQLRRNREAVEQGPQPSEKVGTGMPCTTSLPTNGISRATMMYGRSRASKQSKKAVTKKPASDNLIG